MKFKKFQNGVSKLINESVVTGSLFVAEEAGEVCKEVNRMVRNSEVASNEILAMELSDTLVALTSVANAAGLDLDDLAKAGLEKWAKK